MNMMSTAEFRRIRVKSDRPGGLKRKRETLSFNRDTARRLIDFLAGTRAEELTTEEVQPIMSLGDD